MISDGELMKDYPFTIEWNKNDEFFYITWPDLKGCMAHGGSIEKCIERGKEVKKHWLELYKKRNGRLPEVSLRPF